MTSMLMLFPQQQFYQFRFPWDYANLCFLSLWYYIYISVLFLLKDTHRILIQKHINWVVTVTPDGANGIF